MFHPTPEIALQFVIFVKAYKKNFKLKFERKSIFSF